jgi:apolipoprotein N-acyltransferase
VQAHETDVTSLVFGLVFVGVAAVWVLVQNGVLTAAVLPVAVPALLVGVGLVGVLAALARGRRTPEDGPRRP